MASDVPRSKRFTPEYQTAQKIKAATAQATDQSSQQQELAKKFDKGTLTESEFRSLFQDQFSKYKNYGGLDKSSDAELYAYYKYKVSKGQNLSPDEERNFAISGQIIGRDIRKELGGGLNKVTYGPGYQTNNIPEQTIEIKTEKVPSKVLPIIEQRLRETGSIQPNAIPLASTNSPKSPQQKLQDFYGERLAALGRLEKQGAPQYVIAKVAEGFFLSASLISNPADTAQKTYGYGIEFLQNPIERIKKTGNEFLQDPLGNTLTSIGAGKSLGPITEPFTAPISRFVGTKVSKIQEKIDPRIYKEKTVEILPTSSVPVSLGELQKLEGQKIEVSHVTFESKIKADTLSKIVKKVKGESVNSIRLTGPPTKTLSEYRQFIEQKQFYEYPTTKPGTIQGLGGFAGFFDYLNQASQPKKSFSILSPQPTILVRNATIFKTGKGTAEGIPHGPVTVPGGPEGPITRPLKTAEIQAISILREQEKSTTRTFIAAENQAKLSTERQVTSPVSVSENPITKRPPSRGATLLMKNAGITFARMKVEPPSFLPEGIRSILARTDFFTKTTKFTVIKTRKVPIREGSTLSKIPAVDVGTLDQGPGGRTPQIVSLSSETKKIGPSVGIKPSSNSTIISSNNQISSRRNFLVSSQTIIKSSRSPIPSLGRKSFSPGSPPKSPPTNVTSPPPSSGVQSFVSTSSPPRASSTSTPRSPSIRPPISLPGTPTTRSKRSRNEFEREQLAPAYAVQTRRRGKIVTLPGRFTRRDALAYGSRVAAGTLRASFRIIRSVGVAKEQRITPAMTPFYRSKRNGFLVEPRGYRLKTRSETSEIQGFKAQKRGLRL